MPEQALFQSIKKGTVGTKADVIASHVKMDKRFAFRFDSIVRLQKGGKTHCQPRFACDTYRQEGLRVRRNFVPTSMSEDLVIFGHTRPALMYHCQAVENHIDTGSSPGRRPCVPAQILQYQ